MLLQISLATLTDHAKGRHDSTKAGNSKQQELTPEQELTLVDWIVHQGEMGLPCSVKDIMAEVEVISGKPIGKKWYKKFLLHHPHIHAVKAGRLDPKCAKNFNTTVINDYFDKMEALHACFPTGIPPEHIWNMDKKGIQLGGG